jgi:hypothetical protein
MKLATFNPTIQRPTTSEERRLLTILHALSPEARCQVLADACEVAARHSPPAQEVTHDRDPRPTRPWPQTLR